MTGQLGAAGGPHRSSPLDRAKRTAVHAALRTVGRVSKGVRIGWRDGFDSGTAADYVYANEPHGLRVLPVLGEFVDRRYLATTGARAVRARGELLKQMLREEIAGRGGEIRVLDVAAGPGRCLQDLLAEEQPGGQLRVFCRDRAQSVLEAGRSLAQRRGLPDGSLTYELGDAFDPAPLPEGTAPDLVVVSGLYELVAEDDAVVTSLERLHDMLAPDGALLFTTQTRPPEPEFLGGVPAGAGGGPGRTTCRPVEEAEAWAAKAGFAAGAVDSRREDVGLFTVTRCRRTGG